MIAFHWYAGSNEEEFRVGPCSSREDAIHEGRGEFGDYDGFYIVEAAKSVVDIASHFDIERTIEAIGESIEENYADLDGGRDPLFDPSPMETASLAAMLRSEIRRWQELHRIAVVPWAFSRTRNGEYIPAIASEAEPSPSKEGGE